jgi:iron complex outermembrane receptor protein
MDSAAVTPSPSLAEVLRRMPLIRIRSNSRGQEQPSIRGMEERQIAVLVDGVPLTVGWDNRTDLSVVPMTAARQVELIRGLSSVLAGPNVLGGVVKVGVSHAPVPARMSSPLEVEASMDHEGAYALSGELRRMWGEEDEDRWLLRAGAGWRDTPGAAVAGDLPPVARGETGRLLNSDARSANGYLALRHQGEGGGWLSLSTMAFRAERGVTPELHLIGSDEPDPRFWRIPDHWRSVTSLSAGTGWGETPLGRGDVEATVGLDLQHLEIDSYGSLAYEDSVGGETGDDRTVSLRLVGDHTLGPGTLSGAVTLAETRHDQTLPDDASTFRQRLWSVGVETEQPLGGGDGTAGPFEDPLLTLGGSVDGSAYPETGGKPSRDPISGWGVRASGRAAMADGRLEVHGGVSRKVRFPALRELFSGALGKLRPSHIPPTSRY